MYEYVLYVDVYMSMTNLKITVTKMCVITVNLLGKAKGMKMVAIKDMETPSCCGECDFRKSDPFSGEVYCNRLSNDKNIIIYENVKLDNCPLVEIEEYEVEKLEQIERVINAPMGGKHMKYNKIVEILNG